MEDAMKYIIMCGGNYPAWESPRQLIEIHGEKIIERTIRLLRENGVDDIAISSNDPAFFGFGVPVLRHSNHYYARAYNDMDGDWCNCFYLTDFPVCYIFGDVVFSPEAIKTIVETETDDIAFFGSSFPFSPKYPKAWIEPFAFKVVNTDHLKQAIDDVKRMERMGVFGRRPIAWEVWNVISGGDPNVINPDSYVNINDYTCDIDKPEEVVLFET